MVRVNGVRLDGVAPELVDLVRRGGESDVIWAWVVTRDSEPAVVVSTATGLRVVTRGGDQRIGWDQLNAAQPIGPTAVYLTSNTGVPARVQFRSPEECGQFLRVVHEPNSAEGPPEEDAADHAPDDPLHQTLLRIESQLARIVGLLEDRRTP